LLLLLLPAAVLCISGNISPGLAGGLSCAGRSAPAKLNLPLLCFLAMMND
jgi:hypothetical protein